ncbi:aspartate carbamoyltransferase [Parasponia andersonii]|uniref:Aspartate carbamoyltransferase n=1 Tax=Parasponia andersonii TaxID=3476 RepID=A0A2P5CVS3_PARAD|nr:aspartate carbamoyltransferase [Parasponia andersonii]
MGFSLMVVKKIGLLLLISESLSSTSLAGRQLNSRNEFAKALVMHAITDDDQEILMMNDKEISIVHERLLRAYTQDYGRTDPAPALAKPPPKLIPN